MVLICISLMTIDVGHLFMCQFAIHLSSLERCLYKFLFPFFNYYYYYFWMLLCMSFPHILNINPLMNVLLVDIFSRSVGNLTILLMVSSAV